MGSVVGVLQQEMISGVRVVCACAALVGRIALSNLERERERESTRRFHAFIPSCQSLPGLRINSGTSLHSYIPPPPPSFL